MVHGMGGPFQMLCWPTLIVCLASCGAEKQASSQPPKLTCRLPLGKRTGEQPLSGVIYGSVGAKVELKACPGVRLAFAFIGGEPAGYQTLKQLAVRKEQALGFKAFADGYIVQQFPGEYSLVIISLDRVAEDPAVTGRYKQLAEQPHHR
jgi:hypothetical protein